MAAVESIISCSEEKSLMVRFPDPKQYLLLKQLEEWNIVSCDQLGDTLPAASTNQCASSSQLHFHFFFFILLRALIIEVYLLASVFF